MSLIELKVAAPHDRGVLVYRGGGEGEDRRKEPMERIFYHPSKEEK